MMMLGRQTRLLVQAMYGTSLGPEEEETTVSKYVTALQGGLGASGCNGQRCIKNMTTTVRSRGISSWRAGMDSRQNFGTNSGNEAAVPVVRPGAHHQSIG